jgi:hypothetical protein
VNPTAPAQHHTGEPLRPYADAVVTYAQAGWPCVLPVPPATKFPPPGGFTGADGRDTDHLTLVDFATHRGDDSIALRMPEGVIGIDVDQYAKGGKQKNGAATLAAAVGAWGPLPPTWSSTARGTTEGPGESRILLFRVPPRRYAPQLSTVGMGPDVEIIQRHHRYSVVWPSINPETGSMYRWYRPDGSAAAPGEVPSPTFTLMQIYEFGDVQVFHFDLYRLKSPADALELGIEDACAEGIALIEWPERLGRYLPMDRVDVRLAITGASSRQAEIIPHGRLRERYGEFAA